MEHATREATAFRKQSRTSLGKQSNDTHRHPIVNAPDGLPEATADVAGDADSDALASADGDGDSEGQHKNQNKNSTSTKGGGGGRAILSRKAG